MFHDYTQGAVSRNIWLLARPMILEQLVLASYQLLDGVWMGRLGTTELAGLVMSETLFFVLSSATQGLAVGATAAVARRAGEREFGAASHSAWQVLFLAVGLGIVIGGIGFVLAEPLLVLLGASSEVASVAAAYLRIACGGLFVLMLMQACNAILRGAGEAGCALKVMVLGFGLPMLLDPLLILGWGPFGGLGLAGGALAVVVGACCGLGYAIWVLKKGRRRIGLGAGLGRPDSRLMWRIIRVGLPAWLQMLLRSAAGVVVLGVIALFGTNAVAGYSAAIRIVMFAFIPCFGLGNAAATLVGQNLGAGKPERSSRSAWLSASYSVLYMAVMTVVFVALPEPILSQFSRDPLVLAVAVPALRIVASTQAFNAVGVVMGQSLSGAGHTVPGMFVNLGTLWGLQVPSAYLLTHHTDLGVVGVWMTFAIVNVANGSLYAFWFHRGGWRKQEV